MTSAELSLASYIDHTLLRPDATVQDLDAHVREAVRLHTYAVCVSPSMLPLLTLPDGSELIIAAVCGFPSGKHLPSIKAAEAEQAVAHGAREIDMVIDIGAAVSGRYRQIEAEISCVRSVLPPPIILKVIIESAALTDEQIVNSCLAAKHAGADYVKTSTGFHESGGAVVRDVTIMTQTVGGELGIKASGGIRTRDDALKLIAAGATRLGVSSSSRVLRGTGQTTGY